MNVGMLLWGKEEAEQGEAAASAESRIFRSGT